MKSERRRSFRLRLAFGRLARREAKSVGKVIIGLYID